MDIDKRTVAVRASRVAHLDGVPCSYCGVKMVMRRTVSGRRLHTATEDHVIPRGRRDGGQAGGCWPRD